MKIAREMQLDILARRLTNEMVLDRDKLLARITSDLQKMGDPELREVAKELDIDFEQDKPEEKWTYACPKCNGHSNFRCDMIGIGHIDDDGIEPKHEIDIPDAVEPAHGSNTEVDCDVCGWHGYLREIHVPNQGRST